MPYKTQYGSHYHMTYGCHGATIACDTSGLTPCSDCCGGAKDGGTDGGSALAGGSPNAGAGSHGPTRESMEAADRWRRGATNAMFGGPIDYSKVKNRGQGRTYDEWKAERELDDAVKAASAPDYDFDEMADDAFPFGDGGPYSLYGSSDSFPDGDEGAYYARMSEMLAEVGTDGLGGQGAPGDVSVGDMADTLAGARPVGTTHDEWDDETRRVAEAAGIPESSDGTPTVLMGRVGSLYVFETSHTSTQNPNDPNDHYGEWLYDVKAACVIAPDGTDVSREIEVARNLRDGMDADRERFMRKCRQEAQGQAATHRMEVTREESEAGVAKARTDYERDVVAPWREGYDRWRAENEDRAAAMAEDMRRNRPPHRHRYIEGDVEERMRRAYERRHPRPEPWNYTLPQYQQALDEAQARAERRLAEEGWDEKTAYEEALADVMRRRDPEGRQGVSEGMRRNYEAAMKRLSQWPEAEALMDARFTWGATKGTPVKRPAGWARMFGEAKDEG